MGRAQIEELEKNGKYFSVPRGVSMWPMIRNKEGIVEIHKLDHTARRYDVVMYTRGQEQGVIHRVLHVRDKDYIIVGDNCWQKEYVPKDRVMGIAVRFYRNGKWYEMDHLGYRIYTHIWTDFFFIRRPLIYLRERSRSFFRRLRRKIKGNKE
ncbi:MAG: S24/S26 family peptidase [Clostridiales bacterium]|nr:S24/S26 family peptidase [Clostridiales bacterium]